MSQPVALALTLLFEACAVLLWRARFGAPPGAGRLVLTAVCASLLTHPFAWWANVALVGHVAPWPRAAMIEAAVIAAEALAYRALAPLPMGRAVAVSAWANAVSFGLGLLALLWLRG